MTKELEFLNDVALAICSSLKIELAMYRAIRCILKYMPVDDMYLSRYDSGNNSYKIIAHANKDAGEILNKEFDMPEWIMKTITEFRTTKMSTVVNDCSSDPVLKTFFAHETIHHNSCIVLPLDLDSNNIGVLQIFTKDPKGYSTDDSSLLASVSKPFAISMSNAMKYIELSRFKENLAYENRRLKEKIRYNSCTEIIGRNTGLKNVIQMIRLVAPYNNPIMLLGETGTGKEVLADEIHSLSARVTGPIVKVNCGAIPETLIDSELFGYEKGAFTGASKLKIGKFERADNGTIFLDEVGELTPEAQVRLLRVLEEKEIERIGGSETFYVDIRIISATHKNLEEMVKRGSFREDLFFRLNVFPILVPPLRERKMDIPLFIDYFLKNNAREMGLREIPKISDLEIESLMDYDWPGNVRELKNIVERAMILGRDDNELHFSKLLSGKATSVYTDISNEFKSLEDNMLCHINNALKKTNGKISGPGGAAELLGINQSTLRHRMKKLGLL